MITFKYDGKIYKPSNLDNKLKKLGITINDIEIIDDTKTNTEKDREERIQQNLNANKNYTVNVYWDNQSKGWYIIDRYYPLSSQWGMKFFHEVENGRYRLVKHDVNRNDLTEFFKENFQKVIKNNF